MLAWAHARAYDGGQFLIRIEDIDRGRSRAEHEQQQLEDLHAIGIDWDGQPVRQSKRADAGVYQYALDVLEAKGLVYPCFCSRKEIQQQIQQAASAPHGAPGAYPGTCRDLSATELEQKWAEAKKNGRQPSLRLRSAVTSWQAWEEFAEVDRGQNPRSSCGTWVRGDVDDFVLRRADGMWAYNLAVVVDDLAQGITEILRGDDLLASAARQTYLAYVLNDAEPTSFPDHLFRYIHVPLVVNAEGRRLSKRDGDVTLGEVSASAAQQWIVETLRNPVARQLSGQSKENHQRSRAWQDLDSIVDLPEVIRAAYQDTGCFDIPRQQVVFDSDTQPESAR